MRLLVEKSLQNGAGFKSVRTLLMMILNTSSFFLSHCKEHFHIHSCSMLGCQRAKLCAISIQSVLRTLSGAEAFIHQIKSKLLQVTPFIFPLAESEFNTRIK